MDDNNENDAQGSVIHSPVLWNIPDLPFGIICSFLDTSTLMNLCLVCKKFNSYIKSETPLREWKKRAKDIWSDATYPILSPANPDKLFWRMSCEALQKQKALWTQNAYPLVEIVKKKYKRKAGFSISFCSLQLMHDGSAYIFCKDRDLYFNKTESEHSDICKKYAYRSAITDLTILNDVIYSCSFDNHIQSWKINNGHLQIETSYNFYLRSPNDWPTCLTSYPGQNVLAVGTFYGLVSVFDSRSGDLMLQYKARREDGYQIFRLAINSEHIFSSSFDNIVSVYDQRTRRFLDNIEIGQSVECMKMQQDCVIIGDYDGKLHVINPKNNFEVKELNIGDTRKIRGVHLTYGSLITSSSDAVIISSPTNPPKHMFTFNIPNITIMDYQNGTFALFINDNDELLIYRPVQ